MLTFARGQYLFNFRQRRLPDFCDRRPIRAQVSLPGCSVPLILGINQYTHDTSIALARADSGRVLFALSKERLTRLKHDAGDPAILIRHAIVDLSSLLHVPVQTVLDAIKYIVANNHHFRIGPYERRLPVLVAMNYAPSSSLSPWNLTRGKTELSHHLCHAFAAAHTAPFDEGLLIVMDGMGDALHEWHNAAHDNDASHFCEHNLPGTCDDVDEFREYPESLRSRPGASFREAETAYVFRRNAGKVTLRRVFKRWTREKQPSELPNHSFEEMESVGAMYSRVAALLFRDWNACGKVMGLAPYAKMRSEDTRCKERYFLTGDLFDGTFCVKQGQQKGLKHIENSMADPDLSRAARDYFESMAYHIQNDLEDVVSRFVSDLKRMTGQQNLAFTGGVALNSTLNGVLTSRGDFENVYIPPFPGDEGVAIGCAAFGYSHLATEREEQCEFKTGMQLFMPYLGTHYGEKEICDALAEFKPWISLEYTNVPLQVAKSIASASVVAWFRGRSEFGPRALGNRSILADPRPPQMIDHVNKVVKKREAFRPFAPSVLAEHAHEWFDTCGTASPFMSVTKQSKRKSTVKAVTHVDGSSRLQTVTREQNPAFYDMIDHFRELTGIPMVLNTSFNVAGEPIVESPRDALRTFLNTDGIALLAFPEVVVRRRECPNLAESHEICSACVSFRSHQVQDSDGESLQTSVTYTAVSFRGITADLEEIQEQSVALVDSLQLEILEFVHSRKRTMISEITEWIIRGRDFEVEQEQIEELPVPVDDDIVERVINLYRKRLICID